MFVVFCLKLGGEIVSYDVAKSFKTSQNALKQKKNHTCQLP